MGKALVAWFYKRQAYYPQIILVSTWLVVV